MADAPPALVRLGTRGSALALAQTAMVSAALSARYPDLTPTPVVIRTEGDLDKTSPLRLIGGRGVFASALQAALRRGEIDAAVHSAKDLPSHEPDDLHLRAFLLRDDPRDVLISRHDRPLADLPPNPTIGTSSGRRAAQILALRPDARIVELRGNVDTRLHKAAATDLDAIVIAAAGVLRMGWRERIVEYLSLDSFTPAPGQGALAIETLAEATGPAALLAALDDPDVSLPVRVERAFLRAIGAGCTKPVGAHAERVGEHIHLRAMVASDDATRIARATERLAPAEAEQAAAAIAARLLAEADGARAHGNGLPAMPPVSPLRGLTVLVTRAADQGETFVAALRAAGAEPVLAPTLRIAAPHDPAALAAATSRLLAGHYDWLVLTSANAVASLLRALAGADDLRHTGADDDAKVGGDPKTPAPFPARVAAVGAVTAARLREVGIPVTLVPERFDADAVLAALTAEGIAGQRILLPQGDLASDRLAVGLRAAGGVVEVVEAYRTLPAERLDPTVARRIRAGEIDVVTFASPSSVRNLVALLDGDLMAIAGSAIACVGPVTAAAARELGLHVTLVAEDATIPGLVAALVANRAGLTAGRRPRVSAGRREEIGQ